MRVAPGVVMSYGAVARRKWMRRAVGRRVIPNHFMPCDRIAGLGAISVNIPWVGGGFLRTAARAPMPVIRKPLRKISPLKTFGVGHRNIRLGTLKKARIIPWQCLMGLLVVIAGQGAVCRRFLRWQRMGLRLLVSRRHYG